MGHQKLVTVSAAGKGERMRPHLRDLGLPEDLPKPLVPTGSGETLIGRIVRQAMQIGHVAVYTNYDTIRPIGESPDLPRDVSLLVNRNIMGPLGPLYRDIQRSKEQALMAAGDFWADFNWADFLAFHNQQPTPVSILVGRSIPTTGGARFSVRDDGTVSAWERVERTTGEDLINIGAYIVDPERLVMGQINTLAERTHKEDPFNDAMIAGGLMSAHVLDDVGFNVNNAEICRALWQHTAARKEG
jgi:NDP-sugar pyrophosphorylase family protein